MNTLSKKTANLHSFPIWGLQTQTWVCNQVNQLQSLDVESLEDCECTAYPFYFTGANILQKVVWNGILDD